MTMSRISITAALMMCCASVYAQVEWTEGPGNPVYGIAQDPTMVGMYQPRVIHTADGYKMWYTRQRGAAGENIGFATSPDGIAWTLSDSLALLPSTDGVRFDSKKQAGQAAVVQAGDTLKMWYWGNGPQIGNIGFAWSLDGKSWTKVDGSGTGSSVYDRTMDGSPALALTTPAVIKDGSTYRMWYSRLTAPSGKFTFTLGYATSPDGMVWTNVAGSAAGGDVLALGATGAFDSHGTGFPTVLKDDDGFHMWYTGTDDKDSSRIGYATSPDGLAWTRKEGKGAKGSVLTGTAPTVIKMGSVFKIWYSGSDGAHYAASGAGTGLLADGGIGLNRLNPFNPSMEITYSLARADFVSLAVYDARGGKVATLVRKRQAPGAHSVRMDPGRLPQGLYFYRLKIGADFSDARKMLIP
jgi:hypothetical protein